MSNSNNSIGTTSPPTTGVVAASGIAPGSSLGPNLANAGPFGVYIPPYHNHSHNQPLLPNGVFGPNAVAPLSGSFEGLTEFLISLICARMRWGPYARRPSPGVPPGLVFPDHIKFMSAHETEDRVFVFVVCGDTPAIMYDSRDLFPSDELITKLRMLGA